MKIPLTYKVFDTNGITLTVVKKEIIEWLESHTDIDAVVVDVVWKKMIGFNRSTMTINEKIETCIVPVKDLDLTAVCVKSMHLDIPDEATALLFKLTWL